MKIIKVKRCLDCPKIIYVKTTNRSFHYCSMGMIIAPPSREIKDILKIPKWCPLEDYKDENN